MEITTVRHLKMNLKVLLTGNKIEITPENMDVLLGKLITTLQNPGNLDDNDQEPQTGVSEDGPNAGDTQKPNEPKIENNGK